METPVGRLPMGFATGFLYSGPGSSRWLVTNWHVVTGRRPDDPGVLLSGKPASPGWLRFKVEDPRGHGGQEMEVALYDADGPKWIEGGRELGVDVALLRLDNPPRFAFPFAQTFAPISSGRLEPGVEVVVVGHPFELGVHAPAAIWKGAMVASDRDLIAGDRPWILIDAPGLPGMSGSPVYRRFLDYPETDAERHRSTAGVSATLDDIASDIATSKEAVGLELLGVYAGAIGFKELEAMRLGRVIPIALVEGLLHSGERGINPFPPDLVRER